MKKMSLMFALFLTLPAWGQAFYQIEEKDIAGKPVKLEEYKGRAVLVVNIASQCGFTSQLEDLQKLQAQYAAKGFTVLGVPSNEFGGQTPESDQEMKEFCQKKYNVNFPLLAKGEVNGPNRRPLYKYLTAQKKTSGDIGWNFVKFLVNKKGEVVDRWTSMTSPTSKDITQAIEAAIK